MSNPGVLTETKAIFSSTQQSGSTGSSLSTFSRYKICFTSTPLTCSNNQVNKISLAQFNCHKNFYTVNKFNNRFRIVYDRGGATLNETMLLTEKDYDSIGDVATEFATKLKAVLDAADTSTTYTVTTQIPAAGFVIGSTGKRSINLVLTSAGARALTNLKIQCPQFRTAGTPEDFNDSYVLLGGVRITDSADLTTNSFKITDSNPSGTGTFTIQGHFAMVLHTMPFIYIHCNIAATNLQTQSLGNAATPIDEHVETSTLLAKVPVDVEFCSAQFDTSTPYFIISSQRTITELLFQALDHHGREIPTIDDSGDGLNIETDGNLFSDMVIRHEVLDLGQAENVLDAPFKKFNYQTNQVGQVQLIGGGGF